MSTPKGIKRPKAWDEAVEEAYRFQCAGYKDEVDYKILQKVEGVDRWPKSGFVKKLRRKDGYFIYFDKKRECREKDIHQTKLYNY